MALFDRFLFLGGYDPSRAGPPWGDRPSIFEHLRAGRDGLPDDTDTNDIRWAPGALDGAFGHHGQVGSAEETAYEILAHLKDATRRPSDANLAALYGALTGETNALSLVDPLIEAIVTDDTLPPDRLHALALWLAQNAPDREPVKIALALLGMIPGAEDTDTLLTLASHDEFTLYGVVALLNQEAAERTLFELAQRVSGWGRIQVVERLADTKDREIKRWMLREGYKNEVMYEYLAYTCAMTGELHRALAQDDVDEALLDGAGDLIDALLNGPGPAQGMDDYEHGEAVVGRYLDLLSTRASRIDQFNVVTGIRRFVDETETWSADGRQSIREACEALLEPGRWRPLVEAQLRADERHEMFAALQAAPGVGVDAWPVLFERAERGEDHWYHLMQTDDRERAAKVTRLAEDRLPLDELGSGAADEMGFGEMFAAHSALDFVVQDLGKFPGLGFGLIAVALKSPVVRNRNMAIRALAEWGETSWPPDARPALERAAFAEPCEDVRERMTKVLAGEALDPS